MNTEANARVNAEDWAQQLMTVRQAAAIYPNITAIAPTIDLDGAYELQRAYVRALQEQGEAVLGYKAALTTHVAQQSMGLSKPIVGALMANGRLTDIGNIELTQQCLLETEIGMRLGNDVHNPVTADEIPQLIEACMPLIEVASPNLAAKPNGCDLVATNSASYSYIVGAPHKPNWESIDQQVVALFYEALSEDQPLHHGVAADVLGGQRLAAAWLINTALELDYPIESGTLLMTGAIGGIQPARAGSYRATFGDLGNIDFTIAT